MHKKQNKKNPTLRRKGRVSCWEGNPKNAQLACVCAPLFKSEKVFLSSLFYFRYPLEKWSYSTGFSESRREPDHSRTLSRYVASFCDVCWNLTLIHTEAKLPSTSSTGRTSHVWTLVPFILKYLKRSWQKKYQTKGHLLQRRTIKTKQKFVRFEMIKLKHCWKYDISEMHLWLLF